MRGLAVLLLLVLSAASSAAQQIAYELPATPATPTSAIDSFDKSGLAAEPGADMNSSATSAADSFDVPFGPLLAPDFTGDIRAASSDRVIVNDTIALSGPLVRPLKATSFWDFPLKLLQLVNPFSTSAASLERRIEPVEARAWTTMVGWNPGRSAFVDDTHHEPQMPLLAISLANGR